MEIKTIKIKSDNELGYMIINLEDYDADTQVEYGVEESKPVAKKKVTLPKED